MQIASFLAALDLIQVWEWRNDYNPDELGVEVCDGSAWSFSADIGGRNCHCSGTNSYPSFINPKQTTTKRGRFALLQAAFHDCFAIDAYIHLAKCFAKREAQ